MSSTCVHQERLEADLQQHVANSLTSRVPVLTAYLKELKIIINYLSVMSHVEADKPLTEYMGATFGKEPGYLSSDVKLKHVKHVYLIVKYTQTDLLMGQFQVCCRDIEL